jgi:hypothetical protein
MPRLSRRPIGLDKPLRFYATICAGAQFLCFTSAVLQPECLGGTIEWLSCLFTLDAFKTPFVRALALAAAVADLTQGDLGSSRSLDTARSLQ